MNNNNNNEVSLNNELGQSREGSGETLKSN